MKKIIGALFIILSVLFLSGCEVYNTLYGSAQNQEPVFVPESEIVVEGEESEEPLEEAVSEGEDIQTSLESTEVPTETIVEEILEEEAPEEETSESSEAVSTEAEVTEEEAPESVAVIVTETEVVDLVPEATDPDGDSLIFTFSTPLDENGQWQTTYGDEGEYTITVTASDGELTASEQVLLIVNKREEAPVIDSFSPAEPTVSVTETDSVSFSVVASDLNNDPLQFEWKLDGVTVSEDNTFDFQTTYDDEGSHTIKLDITDGAEVTSQLWSVDIANKNRVPVVQDLDDIAAQETDVVSITVDATDADGDELSFSVDDQRFTQDGNVFSWETDYSSEGQYTVTLSVTDGQDVVDIPVTVSVDNVNRRPVILNILQKS